MVMNSEALREFVHQARYVRYLTEKQEEVSNKRIRELEQRNRELERLNVELRLDYARLKRRLDNFETVD